MVSISVGNGLKSMSAYVGSATSPSFLFELPLVNARLCVGEKGVLGGVEKIFLLCVSCTCSTSLSDKNKGFFI